jgi:hypothetical protein
MTKLIAALVIVAALFVGWQVFKYWEKVDQEKESVRQTAAAPEVNGDALEGLPEKLGPSLAAAKTQGAAGLRNWLKTYGEKVKDPRKAWIELDYCIAVTREDPAEAKRVFAAVKDRTSHSSPVFARIQKLAKTYE